MIMKKNTSYFSETYTESKQTAKETTEGIRNKKKTEKEDDDQEDHG